MRVRVHPADEHGCGHYRLIWVSRALAEQGHDVELAFDHNYRAVWQPSAWGDRIIGLADDVEADVVVLQRPMHRHRVELMAALQAQGVAVVVEIDDDFHAIHPNNAAWRDSNPLHNAEHNRDWLKLACERADLVTVSTPALAARYGQHGRCVVLPNYVPERYLEIDGPSGVPERTNGDDRLQRIGARREGNTDLHGGSNPFVSRPVLGWSGSIDSHPRDLHQTEGAVAEAVLACGAVFRVVGTGKGVQRALRLHDEPDATGWLPLRDYPAALATLDVGIVPLQMSAFNHGKSALKMSEMAAVGVPAVVSPTEDNLRMHAEGLGFVASTSDDWWTHVTRLLRDRPLREEMAAKGREVMRGFTIEGQAWRWMEAWSAAVGANTRTMEVA